jgi:hypothetical protein
MFLTFQDAIDHALDYLGGNPQDAALRDCKRAALEAYRTLTNAHNWSYLYQHGRVITSGAYDSTDSGATIAYTHTGGTYERMVTITGDVWPSWAAEGTYIRVGLVNYRVIDQKSATVLILDDEVNPGADLPSGTAFQIYRDTYLLPADYIAQEQALYERNFGGMDYTHPKEWLYENRYVFAQGIPQMYTITGDKQWPGRLVLRVHPWPMETKTIDFIYKRAPRPLLHALDSAGTVTVPSNTNVITGTSTSFRPDMVGSVIRYAASGTKLPTSEIGPNPAVFETVITNYTSATSVNVSDICPYSLAGVPYTISDRIDIEAEAMASAYLRCVEMHLGMVRVLKDKPSARLQYAEALERAKAADSRSFTGRAAGIHRPLRRRLRDYPIRLDQTE